MDKKITSLTKGGVRRLMEMDNPAENTENVVLQATQIKLFEEKEKKKKNNIKQRLVLSDGVSSTICMVDLKRYSKMQETDDVPGLHDIVSITKCNKNDINGRLILILCDVLSVVYRGLQDKIGSPKDYSVNKKKNRFPEDSTDVSIPEEVISKPGKGDVSVSKDEDTPETEI